jgi:hypothetical protein
MKTITIAVICLSQVACTTVPTRMSYDELRTFKVDCSRRDEQYQFLESQKYTVNERLIVALQMTSILGIVSNAYNGTMKDSENAMAMKHEAMINHAQMEIREHCRIWDAKQTYLKEREQRLNSR